MDDRLTPEEMDARYWQQVRNVADMMGSDGCTGVADFFKDCCLEHDIHYRTGKTITGAIITRRQADALFRQCMQERSKLGRYSPMSWWRWAAVRLLGRTRWEGERDAT